MTSNVVQIRMPSVILKNVEDLVKKGFYKNKSEVIIDAVRHFVGIRQTESDVAQYIREELRGRHVKRGYSEKELDALWEKIRRGKEWKERFGTSAESVMRELRGR
ncbi:MAG: ribbon-helix-helix domain-containing protein [Candidatus Methanoperedens sp.]|nr:ribbon-helix-helix domain-containing protein [Candidatus Methanoperedens sp.]